MEINKLIDCRKQLGFSQQFMADKLAMDVSNYNRREKGIVKISKTEWKKIASILDLTIDYFLGDETKTTIPVSNLTYTVPDYLLENQRKYIQKLEEENTLLRNKLEKLTSSPLSKEMA